MTRIIKHQPWSLVNQLQNEMERLFDRLCR